jgi:hypothetical protein
LCVIVGFYKLAKYSFEMSKSYLLWVGGNEVAGTGDLYVNGLLKDALRTKLIVVA